MSKVLMKLVSVLYFFVKKYSLRYIGTLINCALVKEDKKVIENRFDKS